MNALPTVFEILLIILAIAATILHLTVGFMTEFREWMKRSPKKPVANEAGVEKQSIEVFPLEDANRHPLCNHCPYLRRVPTTLHER